MSKLLIITGGSRGIGKATALFFLEQDWRVISLSRTEADHPEITSISVDLSDFQDLSILNTLREEAAKATQVCLIHNAALISNQSSLAEDPKIFQQHLECAIISPLKLNQAILPSCKPGSSVLYVGSTLSEKAVKNAAAYVTAKHAVLGLMRASCQDLDKTGIHSACICPGFTETEMLSAHLKNQPAQRALLADRSTLHRLIAPKEIAECLYFAANHPVINGAVIHANLGQIET